ncbi:MAG: putative sugar nucleotidyl transferase [Planctomycetales bacterium]
MNLILFEDEQVGQLYPITVGRPAFAVSCGSCRLIDLLSEWSKPLCYITRPHLKTMVATDFPIAASTSESPGPILMINAAMVPSVSVVRRLRDFAEQGEPGLVPWGDRVAAALLPEDQPLGSRDMTVEKLGRYWDSLQLPADQLPPNLPLFDWPHEVVSRHLECLGENLEHRLASGNYREIKDGVFVAEGAKVGEYGVTDSSEGPILLEAGAKVGPYCYMVGPVHVGANSRITEHSALKDAVALGHTTKIGGEVEASIIEPYTNKQHHGFLGHSYLGSWINLGAGTCNSDLKNTYGKVNMEYDGRKTPSGMQFMGCVLGDYAKTAINTCVFTGKVVGACSMLYGSITRNVPSFVNYARSFGQVTEIPVDVAVSTQARMFARRDVVQRPCDVQLLRDMYLLTRHERQLGDDPLSL